MNKKNQKNALPMQAGEAGTVERILAAARSEFAQYGLAGARVDRMAESAHVNKAMLYYHYHSKERLYLEVIRDFFARVSERLRQRALPESDIQEFLLAVAESHAQLVKAMPEFLPILLRELAEQHEEVLNSIVHAISSTGVPSQGRSRFLNEMKAGKFRSVDPRQMIVSFISMSLGYYLLFPIADRMWNISDHERFVAERPHAIVDLFLNGVRSRR